MNDSEELVYAMKVVADVAKALLSDPTYDPYPARGEPPRDKAQDLLERLASGTFASTYYRSVPRYFIACFTENDDQLSQWRAYADDGLGYAVGFRSDANYGAGGQHDVFLERVEYEPEKHVALVRQLIDEAVIVANYAGPTTDPSMHLLYGLWEILPIIKNPAFREEKEWRLIAPDWREDSLGRPNPVFEFRGVGQPYRFIPSRFGVTAKLEIGWLPVGPIADPSKAPFGDLSAALNLPLVHVVAGPRVHARDAARSLAEQCGHITNHEPLAEAVQRCGSVEAAFETDGVYFSRSTASYR